MDLRLLFAAQLRNRLVIAADSKTFSPRAANRDSTRFRVETLMRVGFESDVDVDADAAITSARSTS